MLLEKSLEEAPVVNRNGYWYFIHPITDGVPELRPSYSVKSRTGSSAP